MKLNEKDITILIEGPIRKKITSKVLKKTLELFPKSKIIFSTHVNQIFDKKIKKNKNILILKNKFPKFGYYCDDPKIPHAANFLIENCSVALKKIKTKYCLKMRSDMIFISKKFLKYFYKFNVFNNKFKFVKERVLISSHYTINPHKLPLPFHYSDWFIFGLTQDLKKFFYIPKSKEPEQSRWFEKRKKPFNINLNYYCRYRSEQFLWKSFIKKFFNINFKHAYDAKLKNIYLSDQILVNNCVVLQPELAGFISLKHKTYDNRKNLYFFDFNYKFFDWLKLYKKYCFNDYQFVHKHNNKKFLKSIFFFITNLKLSFSIIKLIIKSKFYTHVVCK